MPDKTPKKIPDKLTRVEIIGGKLEVTLYAPTQRAFDITLAALRELKVNAAVSTVGVIAGDTLSTLEDLCKEIEHPKPAPVAGTTERAAS